MRIGEVSRRYHISVDNLYYYINYGLLVPPKPRGQYVFDETVLQDVEWILALKELNFTLREIHMLLSLKRISGLADSQDMEELKAVYEGKREFCLQEISENRKLSEELMKKSRL
ncbi:MAG: MerR family transcriptional regulator [Blautia hansenii]